MELIEGMYECFVVKIITFKIIIISKILHNTWWVI